MQATFKKEWQSLQEKSKQLRDRLTWARQQSSDRLGVVRIVAMSFHDQCANMISQIAQVNNANQSLAKEIEENHALIDQMIIVKRKALGMITSLEENNGRFRSPVIRDNVCIELRSLLNSLNLERNAIGTDEVVGNELGTPVTEPVGSPVHGEAVSDPSGGEEEARDIPVEG